MNSNNSVTPARKLFKIKPLTVIIILTVIIGTAFLSEKIVFNSSDNQTLQNGPDTSMATLAALFEDENLWTAPDSASIPQNDSGKLIAYGRRLMIHTAEYFGPKGSVMRSTNGLTCQNCHLDAGTRPYGNNLGAVAATYPKFLPRLGAIETIEGKINECFDRSLNGERIDEESKEMKAFVAYIKWLGKDVTKGKIPGGTGGIKAPHLIDRAADPEKGKLVYEQFCARCHGNDGQGQLVTDILKDVAKQQGGSATTEDLYYYPPLWGTHSFNGVATLYRLGKFAGFVKHNMPYPVNYSNAFLTDEQAWDVAAFVNSRERPLKDHSRDYAADISKKPYDFPFAPYSDHFTEEQHKFGPYAEILSAKRK